MRKVSPRFRTSSPPIRLPGVPSESPTGQPQNVGSMVTTRTAVWAAYGFPKRIARIDPDSAKVTFSAPLRQDCPCDALLAAGDGKLWAVGGDGAHIYRLDPDTGETIATGRLHHGSVTGVAVAGGYLWVAMREDGGVWKIDDTGSSIDKVATGRGPESVAAADGAVWVANADDATVTRIDPGSNATRRFHVGHRPLAVAAVGGQVFVGLGQSAAEAAAGLSGPKVVRALSPDFAFSADPANVNGPGDLMLGRAGGAGLMAAVTDARGATTIEPELARAAPSVSRDGRTYTFELRPGLRFSSGEPVTAEAVRYSIERAVSPKLLNHYCRDAVLGDVAGEDAYQAGKADSISGIAVRGERVTITLAAPSPTLPARLTNPCLSVVPPGTPNIPVGLHRPIPSAGPYYIDSFVRGKQLVLRRNPHYAGPRPQALDALIAGGGIAPAEGGARVERGSADYAADPGSPPTPAFAEGGRYERSFGSARRAAALRPAAVGRQRVRPVQHAARDLPQPRAAPRGEPRDRPRSARPQRRRGGAEPADPARRAGLSRRAGVSAASRPRAGARAGPGPRRQRGAGVPGRATGVQAGCAAAARRPRAHRRRRAAPAARRPGRRRRRPLAVDRRRAGRLGARLPRSRSAS